MYISTSCFIYFKCVVSVHLQHQLKNKIAKIMILYKYRFPSTGPLAKGMVKYFDNLLIPSRFQSVQHIDTFTTS